MHLLDAATLIKARREVHAPFNLQIKSANGQIETVEFQKILRLLPGKRIVALANFNGRQVLVKTFLGRAAQRHAAQEQAGVRHLVHACVPTPNLLWQAELANNGQMLAFEYITASVGLQSVWDKAREDDQRLDLLKQALCIVAKLHNRGVIQADIHLDNFLVSDQRIYIIDGGSVVRKTRPPLPEQRSLDNLSHFFAQLLPKFDTLAPLVMPAYEIVRGWQADSMRLASLHNSILNSREARKKYYLKKVFRSCTRFARISSYNTFLMVERSEYDAALQSLLEDPDGYIDRGEVLQTGSAITVALIKLPRRMLVVKRYSIKNSWHGIKRALRKSRAWTSWLNAHQLEFLGIRSLKPIAMLERRMGPLRSRAYFISDYIAAPDALTHLPQLKNPQAQAESLAGLLTQLSANRIVHGDLKATNFLMAEEGPVLIDLDSMAAHKSSRRFECAFTKDLHRFMQNWEGQPALTRHFQGLLAKLYP